MPKTPASTTAPAEDLTATVPGFRSPRRQPADDPLDPEATTVQPPSPDPLEPETPEGASSEGYSPSDPAVEWVRGLSDDEEIDPLEPSPTTSSRTGRSRASSPRADVVLGFQRTIGGLVGLASVGVHYARRAPEDLWIADEDDCDAIAAPLARIAERHAPLDMGAATDLSDGIEAVVATAGYGVKNLQRETAMRAEASIVPPPPPDAGP